MTGNASDNDAASAGTPILVEWREAHERILMRERLTPSPARRRFTIGRSVAADIVVHDEHTAPLHAAIEVGENGEIFLTDLGSLNGIFANGERHRGVTRLKLDGTAFRIGRTRFEIRSAAMLLAPEKADLFSATTRLNDARWLAGVSAGIVVAQLLHASWLDAPRDLAAAFATTLSIAAAASAVWIAIWALLSRVMLGEWRWLRHGAILLGALALSDLAEGLLDAVWYALDLPIWNWRSVGVALATLGTLVWLHLANASTLTPRRAGVIAAACLGLVMLGGYWHSVRPAQRNVNTVEAAIKLYPPVFRLLSSHSLDAYAARTASLKQKADEKMRALVAEDPDGVDDDPAL